MRRHQVLRVGVAYEQEVDCGSGGLGYSWTLLDSAGGLFPLPAIDTRGQTLRLPPYLLDYDTYTAVARVGDREKEGKKSFKYQKLYLVNLKTTL